MKGFVRDNPLFSLCGLNCGLCPMKLGGHCGGCGFGNQSCKVARCGMEHGRTDYCFLCGEYPCARYADEETYDLFITVQNRRSDMEKARRIGVEAYTAEQAEKVELLHRMLSDYNDGRRKTLYCVAVNLLETDELRAALESLEGRPEFGLLSQKERAASLAGILQELAGQRGIALKLRRKPKK